MEEKSTQTYKDTVSVLRGLKAAEIWKFEQYRDELSLYVCPTLIVYSHYQ